MNLLDALAATRPAQLDPAPDPARRTRHLTSALAHTQIATGAEPSPQPGIAETAAAPTARTSPDLAAPARGTPTPGPAAVAHVVPGAATGPGGGAQAAATGSGGTHVVGGRTRRGRRWVGVGLGVVAVGAAAAVVVATLPGGHTPAPPVPRGKADVFTLVAAKAELLPTGNYWYSDQVEAQSYIVRPGNWAVSATGSEYFGWTAAKKGGGQYFAGRDLAFRPWSAADTAAWKSAGSPSTLRVCAGDHYDTIHSRPGGWDADKPQPNSGGTFFIPGKKNATVEDVQRLPTDEDSLAKIIFAPDKIKRAMGLKPNTQLDGIMKERQATPAYKLQRGGGFLQSAPLPPKVQATVMRLLRSQPGVREIDNVTDPLGRRGVALAAPEPRWNIDYVHGTWVKKDQGYGLEEQLIFDPATGAYLGYRDVLTEPGGQWASRAPGFTTFYWAVRSSGWVDAKPALPKSLPF